MVKLKCLCALMLSVGLVGCGPTASDSTEPADTSQTTAEESQPTAASPAPAPAPGPAPSTGPGLEMPADVIEANPAQAASRNAYFGDLHVHTTYSFDAFAFGTIATPYDAYRYAEARRSSTRRLRRPAARNRWTSMR